MSEPQQTDPAGRPPTGGDGRRLDRVPGDRYRGGSGGSAGGGGPIGRRGAYRPILAAVLVADVGALLFFLLGQLDLGPGLLAVAAFTGWATALALVWWGRDAIPATSTRIAAGAILGGWSVVAGVLVDWGVSRLQGGVLGPLDYVDQRYGPVAWLAILVAAGVAAVRAR